MRAQSWPRHAQDAARTVLMQENVIDASATAGVSNRQRLQPGTAILFSGGWVARPMRLAPLRVTPQHVRRSSFANLAGSRAPAAEMRVAPADWLPALRSVVLLVMY